MTRLVHLMLIASCLPLLAEMVTPWKIVSSGLPRCFPDGVLRRPVTYRLTNGENRTEWLSNAEETQLRKDIQRHQADKTQEKKEADERRERHRERRLEEKARRLNREEKQKVKIGGKRIRYTKEMLRKKE